MSINEKENTETVDNDVKQPLNEQYKNGVYLAFMLYEWCIERMVQFPDSDMSKRVLDAIAKARTKPVPMRSLNVTMGKHDSYELCVEVCNKLALVAGDMVLFELADIHDVETALADFMYWDQFRAKMHLRIARCLNSMLYGYYTPPQQSNKNDE